MLFILLSKLYAGIENLKKKIQWAEIGAGRCILLSGWTQLWENVRTDKTYDEDVCQDDKGKKKRLFLRMNFF